MIKLSDVFKEILGKLNTLPYNVYDEIPKEPTNPHIRIDYAYELDNSGKNYDSITYFQYIHVFSTYKGRKEILQIADDVINVLSNDIQTNEFIAYPHLDRKEIQAQESYRHALLVYKYTIYKI